MSSNYLSCSPPSYSSCPNFLANSRTFSQGCPSDRTPVTNLCVSSRDDSFIPLSTWQGEGELKTLDTLSIFPKLTNSNASQVEVPGSESQEDLDLDPPIPVPRLDPQVELLLLPPVEIKTFLYRFLLKPSQVESLFTLQPDFAKYFKLSPKALTLQEIPTHIKKKVAQASKIAALRSSPGLISPRIDPAVYHTNSAAILEFHSLSSSSKVAKVQYHQKALSSNPQNRIVIPLVTSIKEEIINQVLSLCGTLFNGAEMLPPQTQDSSAPPPSSSFSRPRRREHVRMIYGERGVGKSVCLQNLCRMIGLLYPQNVIPLYLDFNDSKLTIQQALHLVATERGCEVPEFTSTAHIIEIMLAGNLKILLVVDELEKVYQREDQDALQIINDLSWISRFRYEGSLAVCCCGSSAALPFLLAKRRAGVSMGPFIERYPLLRKVPEFDLVSLLPTQLTASESNGCFLNDSEYDQVISLFFRDKSELHTNNTIDKELRNNLRFFAGSNLHYMKGILERKGDNEVNQLFRTLQTVTTIPDDLYTRCMSTFVRNHSKLLKAVSFPDGKVDTRKIASTPIEDKMLKFPRVESVINPYFSISDLILVAEEHNFFVAADGSFVRPNTFFHMALHRNKMLTSPE